MRLKKMQPGGPVTCRFKWQGRGSGIAAVLQPLCRVQHFEGNTDKNGKAFGVDA
ncbi:MAG: hypothetical protein ABR955_11375 [Verrucomicrobiota bacterium]|jgi:hypothetical protein